jgi:hypothetical protein
LHLVLVKRSVFCSTSAFLSVSLASRLLAPCVSDKKFLIDCESVARLATTRTSTRDCNDTSRVGKDGVDDNSIKYAKKRVISVVFAVTVWFLLSLCFYCARFCAKAIMVEAQTMEL